MKLLNAKKIKKPVLYEIIDELIENIESSELINDKKDECCEIINDQKDEYCEIFDEIIGHKKIEIIRHQKVEDINMLKSSGNESDRIKKLRLAIKELKAIARKRGVKNDENLLRVRSVEEIDKLEPSKELKKKKIVSSLLCRRKKIGFKPKKTKATKKEVLNLSLKKKYKKYKKLLMN